MSERTPVEKSTLEKDDVLALPPSPDILTEFLEPLGLNEAFEVSGWNIQRGVKRLVQSIDDPTTSPRVVVATIALLRQYALESLQPGRVPVQGLPQLTDPVGAHPLTASDVKQLEDRTLHTQSTLDELGTGSGVGAVKAIVADSDQVEDNDDDNEADSTGEPDSDPKISDGGSEADGGHYDTEQVLGHRPPAGVRAGLCGAG